jgi:hypothetical protein
MVETGQEVLKISDKHEHLIGLFVRAYPIAIAEAEWNFESKSMVEADPEALKILEKREKNYNVQKSTLWLH